MRLIKATQQLLVKPGLLVELSQPLERDLHIQGRTFVKPDRTKVFSYWGWLPVKFANYEAVIIRVSRILLAN